MPIAAIVSKEDNDVSKQIVDMLNAMSHNKRVFSVATEKELVKKKDIKSLGLVETKIAIGRSGFFSDDERVSITSPIGLGDELFLTLEGHILSSLKPTSGIEMRSDQLLHHLIEKEMETSKTLFEAVTSAVPVLRGSFAFVAMGGKSISVARDILGFEPLYWGENRRFIVFASERKALWKIGLRDIAPFPPGYVARVDGGNVNISKVLNLVRPPIVDLSLDVAARNLAEMLKIVFSRYFGNVSNFGVLFSGGIDSSLVAKILCDMGAKVTLYSAAVEESHDADAIDRSASELGIKLRLRTLTLEDVEDYIYKTIYALEQANMMNVSIGLPIYVAMEAASCDGSRIVFAGQGADELFGGYSKYLRVAGNGSGKIEDEMWKDVVQISETNLQRDRAIAMANNICFCLPFLDLDIVDLAMSFPAGLKVRGPEDRMRKHVLREAAKILGLPTSIVYMPKKAAQYSSGSDKAIRKLSRYRGRQPSEYVKHFFEKVLKDTIYNHHAVESSDEAL